MTYGLQVWAQDGTIRLDTTDRLTKLYATIAFSSGSAPLWGYSGSVWTNLSYAQNISIPGYRLDGTWYAYVSVGNYWRVVNEYNDGVTIQAAAYGSRWGYEKVGYTSHYASTYGEITVYRT